MKRKASFLILALCALSACASFTACMTDSQNGGDENIEKSKSNTKIVEQQQDDENECPDGNCPEDKPAAPDMEEMPNATPEFRFAPPRAHKPDAAKDSEDTQSGEDSEDNESNKKPPMPAPRRGGAKPRTPKTATPKTTAPKTTK